MRTPDELRTLVEEHLAALALGSRLGSLEEPVRYALDSGGKRVRPVLCLAVAEAAGGGIAQAVPAACAIELVHTFSLVHDDLPALDDDELRRGRPSVHVAFGEGVAILAGDALLAEAFRLALEYDDAAVARELAEATLGMIAGQHRDITGDVADLEEVERLKTGRLFSAAVGLALLASGVPAEDQGPWRRFGAELGSLFQLVDDVLDGDGFAALLGEDGARLRAGDAAARTRKRLAAVPADTTVLGELVDG